MAGWLAGRLLIIAMVEGEGYELLCLMMHVTLLISDLVLARETMGGDYHALDLWRDELLFAGSPTILETILEPVIEDPELEVISSAKFSERETDSTESKCWFLLEA